MIYEVGKIVKYLVLSSIKLLKLQLFALDKISVFHKKMDTFYNGISDTKFYHLLGIRLSDFLLKILSCCTAVTTWG